MIHMSLFSGIGGFELAAESVGWKNYLSCEINPFGRKVLEYYWPQSYHHTDIKTLDYATINQELTSRFGTHWRTEPIVLTGGFPCQPYSLAGKRLGTEDDRHLWPQMLRVISEIKPEWVVGENVFGIINWSGGLVFEQVQAELEAAGYTVQAYVLPAIGRDAPHRRRRVWFVAHRTNTVFEGLQSRKNSIYESFVATDTQCPGLQEPETGEFREPLPDAERNNTQKHPAHAGGTGWEKLHPTTEPAGARYGSRVDITKLPDPARFPTQSAVRSRNDGFSARLAGITVPKHRIESIKAYGNAVYVPVVLQIFKAIELFNNQ